MGGDGLSQGLEDVLERFRARQRIGLARAISVVEDEREGFEALLHRVLAGGLEARRVGITGPPGAGKSSLAAALATAYRARDEEVGVVAVDPTSPYSGGALLGDRIRMNDLATDRGIFIRSMATRGSLGGLATTSREVVDLMDAFGFARVLVETVGVGQTELEITAAADTVVVVLVPESGDAIQAMKAGLMEIADVFVVNKADRPGAERLARELRVSLQLRAGQTLKDVPAHHGVDLSRAREEAAGKGAGGPGGGGAAAGEDGSPGEDDADGWEIPVLKTTASTGEGVEEVIEAVDAHRAHLEESGELVRRRRERARTRIRDVVERSLVRLAWSDDARLEALETGADAVVAGRETPYSAARGIVADIRGGSAP